MILREEAGGTVLAIGQPAHAELAGRLAEAWDEDLGADLVLATHHHDDVWAQRDAAPPLQPGTGRPETFVEVSAADRVAVWSRAPEVAAPLGSAAELWVLRHAARLHAARDEAEVKAMTAAISARIDVLVAELRAGGPRFDDARLARGTSLLALFDTLSLRLCAGVRTPVDAGVLRLVPVGEDAVAVAPWPFRGTRLEASVAARRLPGRLDDQAALDAAWASAAPVAVPVTLVAA